MLGNLVWIKVTSPELDTRAHPCPRFGHSFTALGSKIYLFGGMTLEKKVLNDLWMFDTGKSLIKVTEKI